MRRNLLWIISLLLITTYALVATFFWIDRSISAAHTNDDVVILTLSIQGLARAVENEWVGLPKEEVLWRLERAAVARDGTAPLVVNDEGEEVWFETVVLRFKSGKLVRVE